MKRQIILIPVSETVVLAYKTLKAACLENGISYNTVTSYFRRKPNDLSYFNKSTGLTIIKSELL